MCSTETVKLFIYYIMLKRKDVIKCVTEEEFPKSTFQFLDTKDTRNKGYGMVREKMNEWRS